MWSDSPKMLLSAPARPALAALASALDRVPIDAAGWASWAPRLAGTTIDYLMVHMGTWRGWRGWRGRRLEGADGKGCRGGRQGLQAHPMPFTTPFALYHQQKLAPWACALGLNRGALS